MTYSFCRNRAPGVEVIADNHHLVVAPSVINGNNFPRIRATERWLWPNVLCNQDASVMKANRPSPASEKLLATRPVSPS